MKKTIIAGLMGLALAAGMAFAGGPSACQQCEIDFLTCEANAGSASALNRCTRIYVNCARANSCVI